MPETVYILGASNISVSGGVSLSGITQGDGSHLLGETITLNSPDWESVLIDDNDADFDDNDGSQRLSGAQTIDGTAYADNRIVEAEYRLTVEDPDGNTYTVIGFNVREPGSPQSYSTIEGLAFLGPQGGWPPENVPLTVVGAAEGPGGGSQDTAYGDYVTPLCFVTGTRLATPGGPRAIENLCEGDQVLTAGGQITRIRWISHSPVGGTSRATDPAFRPVTLRANALGQGRPARDLHLSPQHRVLVAGWRAELHFGEPEILTSAVSLVNGTTILQRDLPGQWDYWHLMCDGHQILLAEGMECESLLPGPAALDAVSDLARKELITLFPQLKTRLEAPVAPLTRRWEGSVLR